MLEFLYLIPLFPLLGVVLNTFVLRGQPEKLVGGVAAAMVGASFVVAAGAFFQLLGMPAESRHFEQELFRWIVVGNFSAQAGFLADQLSMIMMLVVTGVSFLIHVYSIGYMHGDAGFRKFFIYLNLFVFFMLLLVMGSNYLVMFVGWEGVGLCSYLLIGFWFTDELKASAGKKAFIMNRIGDFGFLLAIFLLWTTFGTINFREIEPMAQAYPVGAGVITAICLLLFMGATGKSAQLPLYTWLPDAMAGPTPVSALIHAATMVTAGVYMVVRSNFLFSLSPMAMDVVAWVGGITALFAATIGLVQTDIKKVLAYSTVSQLGYMFLACGVGAYTAAVFHLMTHAFFKGLLFLGSGSVIHGMSDEQDIRFMGGLKDKMPTTYKTFLVGTLAIAGIPGLAGFFSKDEILWKTFESHNYALWAIGATAAFCTAFYMFRLLFLTFFGKFRGSKAQEHHVHESPKLMTIPLIVLAVLSVLGGYVGVPHALGGHNNFHEWLLPILSETGEHAGAHHGVPTAEYVLMAVSVLIALIGIFVAKSWYLGKSSLVESLGKSGTRNLLYNKYWVDQIYDTMISQPLVKLSEIFARYVDQGTVDGSVNGLGATVSGIGGIVRKVQTGVTQNYAVIMSLGVVLLLGTLLWSVLG
ncbi:MAG: NADH-quinone oxidoreductase subunit L [Calditrichaeota bacterium]|nr:NADH-quinone oxidoreductase subunit L [Calditrichota bacterium]MCB9391143.1 NADH-quinone oxidoreductase subunit L [Calditrichota bacterium]